MVGRIGSIEESTARARRLAAGERRLLGIAGPPGAGKSTLAEVIASRLDGLAMCVPMDGFHLANAQLQHLGRADRKGAPDTFDVRGYIALLGRLRANEAPVIYAPEFQRRLDEPIAGAIAVPREITLVITEGNYLLLEESPWDLVRGLLDEVWYLDLDDWDRTERLVSRHVRHGKPPPEALEWVRKSDDLNAALVARTRDRADMVVTSLNLP